MSIKVKIPTPLRVLTAGQAEVPVEASTVDEALKLLNAEFSGFGEKV
jgi:hypothetical protein